MDDLSRELRELSDWLDTPAAPDITVQVRERLSAPPPVSWWRRRWRTLLAGLTVAVVLAILPPGRAALADVFHGLLRFAGVEFVAPAQQSPAALPPSPLPSQRSVTVEQARQLVRFEVRLPAALGPPEQIIVADPDSAGLHRVLSLLYRGGTVRIDAFDGQFDPSFQKQLSGPGVQWLEFHGHTAIWVESPHVLIYIDRDGVRRTETARLAASTLIWQAGDLSYRLEGDLTLDEALTIAKSVR